MLYLLVGEVFGLARVEGKGFVLGLTLELAEGKTLGL